MARTLKGTRARGLPPKLLLSRKQDATGSFPTVWRTASDNRTGKYPVFFNDNKVVSFNQPVTNPGIFVTTYPEYEEKVVVVGSPGNPINESDPIVFDNSFSGTPIVVITEITSNPNTPMVNAFVSVMSATGSIIGFSAPFEGTFVYRAIYQPAYGNPVNVLRSPRYTDQYSLVVAENNIMSSNTSYVTFSDFGSTPTENYVTFWDYNGPPNNTGANLSGSVNSTYITNTSVQVTASAQGGGSTVLHYMGVGPSTASIDVTGIVYPLVMTPQAINAGLSQADKTDLYKQPYFSGSSIVNQPIVASGSMVKGVSDLFVTFTPGQNIEPFMDFANPEADVKSIPTKKDPIYQFYLEGSKVETTGLGFQQPLWSKNKIEIDITPATTQSFTLFKSASVGSYPMGYWNPNTRLYEGIGTGKGIDSYSGNLDGLKLALEEQTFGFTPSSDNAGLLSGFGAGTFNLYGRQMSNYGFPYHPKFQPTSSQQILASDIISEPFLLEKIVLLFSGSLGYRSNTNTGIWSFFILNSRYTIQGKSSPDQSLYYSLGGATVPTLVTSSVLGNRYLDVVDTLQLTLSASQDTRGFLLREQMVVKQSSTSTTMQFALSSSVKSPLLFERGISMPFSGSSGLYFVSIPNLEMSGRNQATEANGRDWINSFEQPMVIGTGTELIGGFGNFTIPVNASYTKNNPYILLPSDKITFGFQLPIDGFNDVAIHSSLEFGKFGINKIILYGSTLRLNPETNQLEEYHDTLNQLLSSNSIHEVIGE